MIRPIIASLVLWCVLCATRSSESARAQLVGDPFSSIWVVPTPIQGRDRSGAEIVAFRESGAAHFAIVQPQGQDPEPACGEYFLELGMTLEDPALVGIGSALPFGHGELAGPWDIGRVGHLTRDGYWVQSGINALADDPADLLPGLQSWQVVAVIPEGEYLTGWQLTSAGYWFITNAGGIIAGSCGIPDPGNPCADLCFLGYMTNEPVQSESKSVGALRGSYRSSDSRH